MIKTCRKRNGQHVAFNADFIEAAIAKAQAATGEKTKSAKDITKTAVLVIEQDYVDEDGIVDVEECQEAAEKALFINGLFDTLMAYHEYRKAHNEVRKLEVKKEWAQSVTEGYVGAPIIDDITDMTTDSTHDTAITKENQSWRVKQNASVSYSIGGNVLNQSSMITEEYWLDTLYDPEIAAYHRQKKFHLHDLGWLGGYCAGWNLKTLIERGITGVPGKISSGPAHHLQALCNQMTNFLGIMQNEWAGAQAFSSFDTYLAPFAKADNLDYKSVKQAIQSFVFGINTPSRWGCVDTETEVLSTDGFKKYNELKKGDMIYTWKDGKLELNPVKEIIIKPWNGKMHAYKGRGYNQTVNTEHRVLHKKHNSNEYAISRSEDIFTAKTPYALPVSFSDSEIENNKLTDPMIMLAAMVYTDGSFDYRNGKIHKITITKSPNRFGNEELVCAAAELGLEFTVSESQSEYGPVNSYIFFGDNARFIENLCGDKFCIHDKFMNMSIEQANLFLTIWASFDGDEDKRLCQYDTDTVRDQLQQIAIMAGHCSYIRTRELESGKFTNYVKIRQTKDVYPSSREEFDYDGQVWCPNVENGTAIFRKDGCVYISGQCQAPFSNITLDWTIPEDLKNIPAIVAGKPLILDGKEITYGDCQAEVDIINKAFMETMIEGDSEGRGFAYPIPTYSITTDFKWDDTENNRLLFEMAGKYGAPYFSNYINSDMKPSDVRSMCCRLRLDLRELRKQNGGNFGAGENTGSIGVVTINLPQIAYLAETEDDFFKRLDKVMCVAARSFETKRKVITAYYDAGLYPYTKAYLPDGYKNHFSTIGIVGMNEACLNAAWIKHDITDPVAHDWANKVLDFMREKLSDFQEQYGCLFNLEATPAESTAYRFARFDKQVYPNIITAGSIGGDPYYTNSTHLPVGATDDVFTALDLEDDMQCKYTSGTVFHCFLGEKMPNWKSAMQLVRTVAENYKLPYFTLSPVYSICEDHGYIEGERKTCPFCGKPTEVYSRITGYYRAVSNWNNGKASEFKERKAYDIEQSFSTHDKEIDMSPDHVNGTEKEPIPVTECGTEDAVISPDTIWYLFKTHTCPQCKMLEDMGILNNYPVEKIFAEDPENKNLVEQLGIQSAPTLVVIEHGTVTSYTGVSNIIDFVKHNN